MNRNLILPAEKNVTQKDKLTKEEQMALRKERRLLNARQKVEERKQSFRDHLAREMKYTRKTYERAYGDWIKMCSDQKYNALKEDLKDLWQGVNRTLDRKDSTLERLLNELHVAEDQYQRNFSQHVQIIDYFINVFKYSLEKMKTAYEHEAESIVLEILEERDCKKEEKDRTVSEYESVVLATNLITKNILKKICEEYNDVVMEIINSNSSECQQCEVKLGRTTDISKKIWRKDIALIQRDQMDPKRQEHYSAYMNRLQTFNQEYTQMEKSTRHCFEVINNLQNTLTNIETNTSCEISRVRGELSRMNEKYWKAKLNHSKGHQKDQALIRSIVAKGHNTIQDLEKLARYGELLLSLVTSCRKLETEEEKVVPWLGQDDFREDKDSGEEEESNLYMRNFWRRASVVKQQALSLEREKENLLKEHETLKSALKKYFDEQAYNQAISSLRISSMPTVSVPVQEAAHIKRITYKNRDMK